ncbi:hypothetical protein HDE72_001035 [Janthinobacterium sp. S3T4]|nr:hypothetical protein [Janthinobacterium sp. S3T4]
MARAVGQALLAQAEIVQRQVLTVHSSTRQTLRSRSD